MRQLLDYLNIGRRDKKDPSNTDDAPTRPDPATTLIIAGEAVPRSESASPAPRTDETDASNTSPSERLEDVVKARRRDRWQAPELEGPEFGGLIERRGVEKRGLMPDKYEEKPREEHRQAEPVDPEIRLSKAKAAAEDDPENSLESTGMFLASLDNSAITLADSGLFRVADEVEIEDEAEPEGGFNPYNRRR